MCHANFMHYSLAAAPAINGNQLYACAGNAIEGNLKLIAVRKFPLVIHGALDFSK